MRAVYTAMLFLRRALLMNTCNRKVKTSNEPGFPKRLKIRRLNGLHGSFDEDQGHLQAL